jgi:hypothetical protein
MEIKEMEIPIINIFYVRSLLRLASASTVIVSTMANVKAIKTDFWLIFGVVGFCFV